MHIFYWILIIAIAVLIINMIFLLQMKSRHIVRLAPVIAVTAAGYLLAGCLYLAAVSHGTDVLTHTPAASFSIDPQSYQTDTQGDRTIYTFHCTNGILLCFDDTSLLSDNGSATPSSQHPQTVDIYSCQVRKGFAWCYLSRDTQIRYALH